MQMRLVQSIRSNRLTDIVVAGVWLLGYQIDFIRGSLAFLIELAVSRYR